MKKYHNTHKLYKHFIPISAKSKTDYASNFTDMFRKIAYKEYWTVFINGGPSMNNYVSLRTEELTRIFICTIEEQK